MESKNGVSAPRDGFGSSIGALVALVGSAIGLGNLWRFPYLMGTNGGSAFILIYIAFVIVLCVPIMIVEFSLGRRSQASSFRAFRVLAPGSKWYLIGMLFVISSVLVLAFYCVVGGWTMDYLYRAITFSLPKTAAGESFRLATSTTFRPLIFTLVFLISSAMVLLSGVKSGIEKCAKLMMPLLFVLIIVLMVKSLSLEGSKAGVEFLLKPDFSKVNSRTILAALGQAFFSLSIGMGTVLTYGSYVAKKENIIAMSTKTAVADTVFALLAGLAIMPAVFALGMSPSEGPGLLFIVLPEVFAQIAGGSIFAILFFLAAFLAAITSAFSILEVIVAYLSEEYGIDRKKAIYISSSICLVLAVMSSLSQGPLAEFKLLGFDFFSLCDALTTNLLMPLGSLLMVIFVGWRMPKSYFIDEISCHNTMRYKQGLYKIIYFIVKFFAPLAIITIIICGWLS